FSQVKIVGEKLCAQIARQPNQFGIYFRLVGKIAIVDFYFVARIALDAVEHLQPAPAPSALDPIARVGNHLQFLQNEARHHDDSFQEVSFNQVGDAPIDDYAGIQQEQIVRPVLRREADV